MRTILRIAGSAMVLISTTLIAADDPIVATVNGADIKRSTLQLYTVEARQRQQQQPASSDALIDDLINMQLLYQEAKQKNLDENPEYQKRINFIDVSLLSQVAMQDYIANNPIPEADLKKTYDEQIGKMTFEELKARHILTESETDAQSVIQQLDKGGDFAELAKTHSTGPSGPKGGDLGWFNPRQMVPEFSTAVMTLKNGEYTKSPVQTQYGWHVILREDRRDAPPPPFESVKPQINAMLEQQHIQKHILALREKAKIQKHEAQ